jgi:tRNA threonylcarbamoyladenosine modification (KEOPS) complex  Pcc1 subunit
VWLQVRRRSLRTLDKTWSGIHQGPGSLDPPLPKRRLLLEPRRSQAEAKILIDAPRSVVEIIITSLGPELESGISDRSNVVIEASEKGLVVKVVADDKVAFRAAVNSYLYWIQGIMDIGSRIQPNL